MGTDQMEEQPRDSGLPERWKGRSRHSYIYGVLVLVALAVVAAACSRDTSAEMEVIALPEPAMGIERPQELEIQLPFVISGWAIDRAAIAGSGIDLVQVLDGGCEGAVIGAAEYGLERPDIAERDGEQFRYSGWKFEVARLHPGERILAVRTQSHGAESYNQCEALPITVLADEER
jgi:hypothetical protein